MSTKRLIPRALFEPLMGIQSSDLTDNDILLDLVKLETPLAIEEAFKSKKTFATVFEINTTGYFLDIPKSYWIDALQECIKFNLVEEKYEECTRLSKLIEEIKRASKKPIKQKNDGEGIDGDTVCD
jgi:hypothetical protein